jgi:glycosyltransferase involved in cell wall biosynthesis
MRVLLMCTTFGVGGITRHATELGQWLRERGHKVNFAGTEGPWGNRELEPGFLPLRTQDVSNLGGGIASRIAALTGSALTLRRWLKHNPVDLIHAHESAPALVARLASFGMEIPIAVTYHGSEPERVGQFAKIAKFSADLIISVSRRCGEELHAIGGVPKAKIQVIGLGLKPMPAIDASRAAELRASVLGGDGRFLVVTIARITHQKGIDVLVEVARRVVAQRPDIHFALVGDGPQTQEAIGWAREAGVQDHFHFVGRSDEPHAWLKAGDLFLLTSRWEALPFTIAEAFQAGAPALTTDCGGCAELIDDTVGKVVPIGDVEALSAAILDLAADEPRRKAMSTAALRRSNDERFDPAVVHATIEQTYRDLVARKGR